MAINFSTVGATQPQPENEVVATQGITLDLNKGNVLNLTKSNPTLSKVAFAAGWDTSSNSGVSVDLDVSAFILGANNKISSGADVIFFNNKTAPGVTLDGDNRTGAGDGDDETIRVDLSLLPATTHKVVFVVNIFESEQRRQTFQQVQNSYIRLVDEVTNQEIARYNLKEDHSLDTAVILGELTRNGNEWAFHAMGEGLVAKDLNVLAGRFS